MFHDTTNQFNWYTYFICGAYGQNHRAYHNERHLQDIFYMAQDLNLMLSENQKLAILYHDIVYIPGNPTNEELSVMLMKTHIAQHPVAFKAAWPNVDVKKVSQIILDTKSHKATIDESRVVLDLDMAIMAANPERYAEYVEEIKREFAQFAGPQFNAGRKQFLESLLAQEEIFITDPFWRELENNARNNIERELAGY